MEYYSELKPQIRYNASVFPIDVNKVTHWLYFQNDAKKHDTVPFPNKIMC